LTSVASVIEGDVIGFQILYYNLSVT
jgi:hypothetical protein